MTSPYRRERGVRQLPWSISRRVELVLLGACGLAIAAGITLGALFFDLARGPVGGGVCLALLGGAGIVKLLRTYGPGWSKSGAVLIPMMAGVSLGAMYGGGVRDRFAVTACKAGNVEACRTFRYHRDQATRDLAYRTVCESGDLFWCVTLLDKPAPGPPDETACRVVAEMCSGAREAAPSIRAAACAATKRRCEAPR